MAPQETPHAIVVKLLSPLLLIMLMVYGLVTTGSAKAQISSTYPSVAQREQVAKQFMVGMRLTQVEQVLHGAGLQRLSVNTKPSPAASSILLYVLGYTKQSLDGVLF